MLKITAPGGDSNRVIITDMNTGQDVNGLIAIKGADIRLRGGHPVEAAVEVFMFEPDLECERFDWKTKHPVTGDYAPLAALEFRDGTRVTFREDGAPVVNEPVPEGERTYGDEIHGLISDAPKPIDPASSAVYAAAMRKAADIAMRAAIEAEGGEAPAPKSETVTPTLALDAKGTLHRLAKEMFGDGVPEPADDVTVAEMVDALGFHLRLRWEPLPTALADGLSTVEPFTGTNGKPVEVKPADFWTVMRPARIKGADLDGTVAGLERAWAVDASAPQADASVRIARLSPDNFLLVTGSAHTDVDGSLSEVLSHASAHLTAGTKAVPITKGLEAFGCQTVTIERFGDRYTASTGPDENGMAVGIAANPEHSAEESLSSALQFARQHLTAAIEPAAA